MAGSVLSRYLNPEILRRIADHAIEPRGLVGGNLSGAHKSPLSGFAVEFSGHRDYIVGDDPKHIDWRLFYKRERLSIKQYEMETNFVCHLLLDISASMRYGEGASQKLSYAAQAAMTLGHAIISHNDKVSLATFDDQVRGHLPPGNSLALIHRMIEHLDQVNPVESTSLAQCVLDLAGRMGRREIVMIFSDFLTNLDELESAIQRLKYHRHEIVLFHVLHREERSFELDGMIKFLGLEDGSEYLAQASDIRDAYLQALGGYEAQFEEICRRNGVERVRLNTNQDLGDDLIEYLNHRSRISLR